MKERTESEEPRSEPSPHDRYFRHVFTQPEAMRDLVVNVVAPELGGIGAGLRRGYGMGDAASGPGGPGGDPVVAIEPSSESFVDAELSEHRTDLLVVLRTASGVELGVYLLFEHKARNERNTIFQLMRYHAAVLGHMVEQGRKKRRLPLPVVAVVVYNGPGRWSAATELETAMGLSGETALHMNRFAHFRYLVFDVGLGMSDTFIGGPLTRTALQAMHAASRKLGKKGVLELARSLAHPELPAEFRNTTLRYLQSGRQDNTDELLAELKKEGYTTMGNTMISWAEARRQEGLKQGLTKTLLRFAERKFSVTNADRERVRSAADPEKLQAALDQIIEPEATLESVLRLLD